MGLFNTCHLAVRAFLWGGCCDLCSPVSSYKTWRSAASLMCLLRPNQLTISMVGILLNDCTAAKLAEDALRLDTYGTTPSCARRWEHVSPDSGCLLIRSLYFLTSLLWALQCYSKIPALSFDYLGFDRKEILFHNGLWIVTPMRIFIFLLSTGNRHFYC
jgi:hypothetical protein